MPWWSEREGLIATVARALGQAPPLLRRIVAKKVARLGEVYAGVMVPPE
jgi:hypothetical protein